MSNPEVDGLITELGQILQQNREKRNAADAMLMGIQQGHAQAEMRRHNQEQLKTAISSGYGKDKAYSLRDSGVASAETLSPSTGAKGRVGLAEQYARGRGDELPENPYRQQNDPYQFLKENDTAAPPPQDAGALEEQKKRFTQTLMLSRGEQGGPLGAAGQPNAVDPSVSAAMNPQASPGQTAQLQAAGNPDLGNFGHINEQIVNGAGPPSSSYGGDKAYSMKGTSPAASALSPSTTGAGRAAAGGNGMSPDDYALLEALAQRYQSPEELRGNPR